MDLYKHLQVEYNGIRDVITKYTSEGNIVNFLDGLKKGIEEKDLEIIKYTVGEIFNWYQKNISKINTNKYVFSKEEHARNFKLIDEFQKELENYHFQDEQSEPNIDIKNTIPKIFLSHKSDDIKYGNAIEKLICGLGVRNDQLIYTSHPLHKIPLDTDIYEYLRNNIDRNMFMIILWSNTYLESPACLNEMGAAWVVQSDYTNIYTPDFDFGNPKYHECSVDTRKMGAVLNGTANCKASIIELKNKILKIFDLTIEEQYWTYLLDQFLDDIAED
ncbi:TIR domain-containing protein [Anaerobium acetethylicum]|uniref:TIR domain-containing protein n=1 Tax=Anaerobium acetethylicum TaxID=1619234 RepID=A0A1D3TXQ2_9FIRM|nr:toll/interleukin-1 receptor domain-containing protein [Anaerobium acetethylicum]SCP99139.1 hypothetical protein SAMN05421730_10339 [Anaerobium acetethylicum]